MPTVPAVGFQMPPSKASGFSPIFDAVTDREMLAVCRACPMISYALALISPPAILITPTRAAAGRYR